ncbi:hypothetical protein ACSLOD_27750, partial [Escherichia coli]
MAVTVETIKKGRTVVALHFRFKSGNESKYSAAVMVIVFCNSASAPDFNRLIHSNRKRCSCRVNL